MSHETDRRRYILPYLYKGNYNTLMKFLSPKLSDPVIFRTHVLKHYYKHGPSSAIDAFGIKRSTLFNWKKIYEDSGKNPYSLVPKSTRPHHTRTMTLDPELVEFIKQMRMEFDNIGKLKIKYFLDEYAKSVEKTSYGTTKINTIIKRKRFSYSKRRTKKRIKPLTQRVKRSPKETIPGYIEMDTVHLWVLGRKHYFMTALDVVTRFAWVTKVKSQNSPWAKQAYIEFERNYKEKTRVIQTDNGSEFLGTFHKYLEEKRITHEFIYPKSPRVNGYIERFNRTFKEEFLYKYELDLQEKIFNQKLKNYLIWYNTKRPHQGLGMKSPLDYMQTFTR